jgi:hypothetical protein
MAYRRMRAHASVRILLREISVFKRGSQGDPLFVVVDTFGESELCKTIGFAIACATDICGISQKESARFSSDSATGDFRFLKEDRNRDPLFVV